MPQKYRINPHTGKLDRIDDPTQDIDENSIIDKAETLDDGVGNTVTAANAKDAVEKRHEHTNKTTLDAVEEALTTALKADYDDAVSKEHEHANKTLLDTYTQTEANLADAISKKHSQNTDTQLNAGDIDVSGSYIEMTKDFETDRWMDKNTNTFFGILVLGAGNLSDTVGSHTAFGYKALYSLTTAYYNTAVGAEALRDNQTGNSNVAVGTQASKLATGAWNTAVGYRALYASAGNDNVAVGHEALRRLSSGDRNTALGRLALYYMQNGSNATTLVNCAGLGRDSRVSGNNQVQLGDSATTTYAYGAVQDRSDERDKTDIANTDLGLDFIMKLRPIKFRWDYREDYFEEVLNEETGDSELVPVTKDGSRKRTRFHQGLIAQEVKVAMDELGIDFGGYQDHSINGGNDVKTLGYQELIPVMIKAIQELKAEIEELKQP
jgi:hypothetical protein